MNNVKWYELSGRDPDVVLSSKALITRNLTGYKFPSKMSMEEKDEVIDKVSEALSGRDFEKYLLEGISESDRSDLIDAQVLSERGMFETPEGKAILTNQDRSLSVLIGNNDHIKIKAQASGYTDSVYRAAEEVAVELEKKLDIAYSSKYGFLGSSINNTGLGVKLLYTIAIPGIAGTGGGIKEIKQAVTSRDWKIYPFFSDKNVKCDVYIISSTAALGVDESMILDMGKRLIEEIVKIERMCRENLYKNRPDILENNFYRSYGILYYSKCIDPMEAIDLLGWIRLFHGNEDRSEIDLSDEQINTIISRLLWEIFPMLLLKSEYRSDEKYTAMRIAGILKRKNVQ